MSSPLRPSKVLGIGVLGEQLVEQFFADRFLHRASFLSQERQPSANQSARLQENSDRLDSLLELVIRRFEEGAIVHLAEDGSEVFANLMPPLIALLEESESFMSNLAHTRVLTSADPFLSKGLKVLRKRIHVSSIRHEDWTILAPRPRFAKRSIPQRGLVSSGTRRRPTPPSPQSPP